MMYQLLKTTSKFLFLCATTVLCQVPTIPKEVDQTPPMFYRSHRVLGGLKLKLDKRFTLTNFGALYFGDGAQYRDAERTDPYAYNGWDWIPGFLFDYGEVVDGIKFSTGADIYITDRRLTKGFEERVEYKPRWNVILTKPLAFGGSVQWISRFERAFKETYLLKKINADGSIEKVDELRLLTTVYRYRSTLKLTSPSFTKLQITPYVYSESFSARNKLEQYYSETEFGTSFTPVKGLSISLADNYQMSYREEDVIRNHMICLYAFYTIDLSSWAFLKN